ncbi:MAG TPA: TIGR00296 family protein [Candidatus Angelobacter sp.]|nr:TIGR00296 family protein [Candidatus Angelobacter sp.]
MLTIEEGSVLVKTARAAVESHLSGKEPRWPVDPSPSLKEERGVFVTLVDHLNGGNLRGCIGIPFPTRSLLEQVRIAAVEAATTDFRFDPVSLEELQKRIVLEATVLSIVEPIWVRNPLDLRENILVGRDGLMVEGRGSHGLLLPQVAVDEGFDSEEFLSHCCLKADLPPDSWLTGDVRVSRFQGQVFAEEKPSGRVFERRLKP